MTFVNEDELIVDLIIIERDDGEFEGFFELDEHIRFVSRGRDNGQN